MKVLVLLSLVSCLLPAVLGQFGVCNSDSDCLLVGYHCCSGTIFCCPSGFMCTGTDTCISYGVIIGPVVGFVVVAAAVGFLIYWKKCRNRPIR